MQDSPIGSVTREDAARFLETIADLRPDYGKFGNVKALPLNELLARYKGPPGLSNATSIGMGAPYVACSSGHSIANSTKGLIHLWAIVVASVGHRERDGSLSALGN